MIEDFDEVKKQLTELASVINLFKTESVQLRIVDLIFERLAKGNGKRLKGGSPRTRGAGRKDKNGPKPKETSQGRYGKGSRLGAMSVLNQLVAEGFFKSGKKTISDIIEHCKSKKARSFKPSDLSGSLSRFVRHKKLDREKNEKGRFSYFQK